MALLFLRVISACADGKIRIYSLLNGHCLKVMKANGRGDPVLSFFIQGNRWVVGVGVRALSSSVWMGFSLLWGTGPRFAGSRRAGSAPSSFGCSRVIGFWGLGGSGTLHKT